MILKADDIMQKGDLVYYQWESSPGLEIQGGFIGCAVKELGGYGQGMIAKVERPEPQPDYKAIAERLAEVLSDYKDLLDTAQGVRERLCDALADYDSLKCGE